MDCVCNYHWFMKRTSQCSDIHLQVYTAQSKWLSSFVTQGGRTYSVVEYIPWTTNLRVIDFLSGYYVSTSWVAQCKRSKVRVPRELYIRNKPLTVQTVTTGCTDTLNKQSQWLPLGMGRWALKILMALSSPARQSIIARWPQFANGLILI